MNCEPFQQRNELIVESVIFERLVIKLWLSEEIFFLKVTFSKNKTVIEVDDGFLLV